ncbi:MAG: nucleoside recognition domain-containing protein [Rikenellaceae bacterium]
MVLNYIWAALFLIAFATAAISTLFGGCTKLFADMVTATFDYAKLGFEISIGLTGVLTLWLGIMKIGERAGVVTALARFASPLFGKLFPEIPSNHPVVGSMFMNFSANLLGLDNAATPIGLSVMRELQDLNTDKSRASNSMIMFLVINASGLTILPISVMMYRAQMGAENAADVFIPIMIATGVSTLTAIAATAIKQRINLFQRAVIIPFAIFITLLGWLTYIFVTGDKEVMSTHATTVSSVILMSIISLFMLMGIIKRINIYESFIEGAKQGFATAITIIPYLIAILVAIGVFRASGAMEYIISAMRIGVESLGLNSDFTGAMPTILMKPLSGSGARGMMIDAINEYGVDSFVGRLSSVVQGSTDTTFYVVALYYGAVAVQKIRYTLTISLFADLMGIIAAIIVSYIFW